MNGYAQEGSCYLSTELLYKLEGLEHHKRTNCGDLKEETARYAKNCHCFIDERKVEALIAPEHRKVTIISMSVTNFLTYNSVTMFYLAVPLGTSGFL